jgi:hypothetical protein
MEFLCFRYGEILQSLKSSFRMTVAKCHSDREAFYFDEESYFYSNTEFLCFRYGEILQSPKSFIRMTLAKCHSDREIFTSTRNLNVIPIEKFLLRRGISMSFRQRRFFTSTRNLIFISTRNFYVFDMERFFSR